MTRRAAALAAVVLLAAACGGGGKKGGSVPEGASLAPKSSVAFISLNSDSSDQWRQVQALAARFPGTPQFVSRLEKQLKGLDFDRDVKPALGPEVDIVALDP